MRLSPQLWQQIIAATQTQPTWHERLSWWYHTQSDATIHLVILREPYLSRILSGQKRIESRFAHDRRPPFDRVAVGDILLLKRAGGPLAGLALATEVISRPLSAGEIHEIRRAYEPDLAIDDPDFWSAHATDRYVTLIWINDVWPLPPLPLPRRDQRGWVIVQR
ncbi:MAG: ASCH domain-containing protein [Chloroflexus sp.]|uniref:ASCH domain-containing protein n=1 Tax=Chloroflexus sp. TaxID=1904827 RepID=UPI00404AAD55